MVTLIDLPEVKEITRLGKTAIYRAMRRGEFPQPVKIGRAARWPRHEIQEWIEERMQERAAA